MADTKNGWTILSCTQSGTNGKWRVTARRGCQVLHHEAYSEAEARAFDPAAVCPTASLR